MEAEARFPVAAVDSDKAAAVEERVQKTLKHACLFVCLSIIILYVILLCIFVAYFQVTPNTTTTTTNSNINLCIEGQDCLFLKRDVFFYERGFPGCSFSL